MMVYIQVVGLNRFIFNDDNVTKIKFIESRGKNKKDFILKPSYAGYGVQPHPGG